MKPIAIIGVILIVLGIFALAYQGFTYVTQETVADIGPLQLEVERKRTVPLPPILGALAVAAGVLLVVVGARRP
jgi:drug/metabolite transporter (DMT)-like permease